MKYRRRRKVVEAQQWHGVNDDGPTAVPPGVFWDSDGPSVFVNTVAGRVYPKPGDWIIEGVMGEFWVCEGDTFHLYYKPFQS